MPIWDVASLFLFIYCMLAYDCDKYALALFSNTIASQKIVLMKRTNIATFRVMFYIS